MTKEPQWEKTESLVPHPKLVELMSKLKQLSDIETKIMTEMKNALEDQVKKGEDGRSLSLGINKFM